MHWEEYVQFDALGLTELLRSKQVSQKELLEIAISTCKLENAELNLLVTPLYDQVWQQLAQTQLNLTDSESPFAGVPFLIKDDLDYQGSVTSLGSQLLQNRRASKDSTIVERFKQAGLLIIGKTNTPELGLTITTEPRAFGPTYHPLDRKNSVGGSSGGSAAAVAAGVVPMAHGSDGGGSIRIPASLCGLFGLKPTRARMPVGPLSGEQWGGLVCHHVLTRSVRDSAAVLDACAGPELGAPYHVVPHSNTYQDSLLKPVPKLKIALYNQSPHGGELAADVKDAVAAVAVACEQLGHHVEEVSLPMRPAYFGRAFFTIMVTHARALLQPLIQSRKQADKTLSAIQDIEPLTAYILKQGEFISGVDYLEAKAAFHRLSCKMAVFMESYDLLLTPLLTQSQLALGEFGTGIFSHLSDLSESEQELKLQQYLSRVAELNPFAPIANITGQPAMAVPIKMSQRSLPYSCQFMAPFGAEHVLFQLAAQLEQLPLWYKHLFKTG